MLLVIDSELLRSEVRMEVGYPVTGELFPHVYGPIDVDAVVEVRRLEPPHAWVSDQITEHERSSWDGARVVRPGDCNSAPLF